MRREFVRQRFVFLFIFLFSFSYFSFFQLCFALMRRKETFAKAALTLTGFENILRPLALPLSLSSSREQYKVVSVVEEIKMKLLKICHNKLPQWRQICPSLLSLSFPRSSSQVLPCWLLLFAVVFLFLLKLFQIAVPGIVWGGGGTLAVEIPH